MAPSGGLLPDWGHYDEVAEGYERFLAVSASSFAAAVSKDMIAPMTRPRSPVGHRDCRAMKSGRRTTTTAGRG